MGVLALFDVVYSTCQGAMAPTRRQHWCVACFRSAPFPLPFFFFFYFSRVMKVE